MSGVSWVGLMSGVVWFSEGLITTGVGWVGLMSGVVWFSAMSGIVFFSG